VPRPHGLRRSLTIRPNPRMRCEHSSAMPDIRPLRPTDDRAGFTSGQPDLDRFFRQTAGQHQFRKHLSVTYVAEIDGRMAGFSTLCAGTLGADALGFPTQRWPRHPLPILRLARLAVARRFARHGVGDMLTRSAM